MYPKNAASPERISVGAVVQISDGVVQTSGVSITVTPQGGASGAGGGTTAYEQGVVIYTPTQAETNYTSFIVTAYKTGCIPVAVTVVTVAGSTAGLASLAADQAVNATKIGGTTQTGRDIGASVLLSSGTGAGQISLASGLVTLAGVTHTGAVIPTVTTTTTATNVTTVNGLAANVITAAAIAADAVTEIQAGLSTIDAAGVRTAVGLASANLDTQLAAIPTDTENATAVLNAAASAPIAADAKKMNGSTINGTGTAGDLWRGA
jgi:hypothetical protein